MDASDQEQQKSASVRTQVFQANFDSLDEVRNFVGQAAEACGLSEDAVFQVQLAVDEAFSNIVEHSYGGECLEDVACTCEVDQESLVVLLQDFGRPFDPGSIPEPDLKSSLEDRDVGGLGLYFMRKMMDEVYFSYSPGSNGGIPCNTVMMVKHKGR
jgi:anti-sigma regulatory factor (Ser/Thr protein kinase)